MRTDKRGEDRKKRILRTNNYYIDGMRNTLSFAAPTSHYTHPHYSHLILFLASLSLPPPILFPAPPPSSPFTPVPAQDTKLAACDLGAGCLENCADQGICLPVRLGTDITYEGPSKGPPYVPSTTLYCHCDTGYYGPTCIFTSPPMCQADHHSSLKLDLYDSFGDGWTFANYALTSASTGMIVDGAFDSLCSGKVAQRKYCVTEGTAQTV
jgi:hypothetical protein